MDHHEKLAWAAVHIRTLELEANRFLVENPFQVRAIQRQKSVHFDVVVERAALLPSHWPLIVGDILHNMRSALDHIVWALTERNSVRPNPAQLNKIAFPICTSRGRYFGSKDQVGNGARERQAGWVGAPALEIIDALQPFNFGDDADEHPLQVVARYDNEDKHRKLIASAVAPRGVQFGVRWSSADRPFSMTGFTFAPNPPFGLEQGSNLGLFTFSDGTNCHEASDIFVEPKFDADIAFGLTDGAPLFNLQGLKTVLNTIHIEVVRPLDAVLTSQNES